MTKRLSITVISIVLLLLAYCPPGEATEKIKIIGEYSYTYGDSESLVEAKSICYSMAVRNAIESYKTFVTATSTVKDYQLIKDLIQTISSGYVEDLKTVKETVKGRTVYAEVEGYIVPGVVDKVLKREVSRIQGKEPEGIANNGYIKILKIRAVKKRILRIIVTYKIVQKITQSVILIDYYDSNGNPIDGAKKYSEGGLMVGEIRTVSFDPPFSAQSYRVWLPQGKTSR